jgi:glutaminyl-peptide cyclotransferase
MNSSSFSLRRLLPLLGLVPFSFLVLGDTSSPSVQRLTVSVIAEYPHDAQAYTQGLVFHEGRMFESTGLYGESTLRETDVQTGAVLRSIALPVDRFGEGLALVGDRLFQLTWRAGEAYVYTRDTFEKLDTFSYSTEGWGLCHDGSRLIMSDGSDRLTFRSPATFDVETSATVTLDGAPVRRLNELEYVNGYVYANVFLTDEIMKIDPATGRVVAVIDASSLYPASERAYDEVLNGIAYNPATQTFYLTGKRWPTLYEVVFVPAP